MEGPRYDLRDEVAQEMGDLHVRAKDGAPATFLYMMEEEWQGVHAEEKHYDHLNEDYYSGLADVLVGYVLSELDALRNRASHNEEIQQAAHIQRLRERLADAQRLLRIDVKDLERGDRMKGVVR